MRKYTTGFTIIEMLIATVLMSVLGISILSLQFMFAQNELVAFNSFTNVTEANALTRQITNELRRARPSEIGSFAFERLDDYEIIFFSDIDLDSRVERVRYSLLGATIEKGVIEPTDAPVSYLAENETTRIVTTNVRNGSIPIFTYYNRNWPSDTTNNPLALSVRLSDTQLIEIYLVVNSNIADPQGEYSLSSQVQPRILKNNL